MKRRGARKPGIMKCWLDGLGPSQDGPEKGENIQNYESKKTSPTFFKSPPDLSE